MHFFQLAAAIKQLGKETHIMPPFHYPLEFNKLGITLYYIACKRIIKVVQDKLFGFALVGSKNAGLGNDKNLFILETLKNHNEYNNTVITTLRDMGYDFVTVSELTLKGDTSIDVNGVQKAA